MTRKLVIFISISILYIVSSCKNEEKKEETGRFKVTSPFIKDTNLTQEYVCQIKSYQHIELRAMEQGYLQKIYVDEGQYVKKGQSMFKIMPLMYQAELNKAKAEANYTKIELANTQQLANDNIVSKNELALARAKNDRANAEVALANTHLNFTQINAPFSGIMDRFHVRLGSMVEEGELLTELSDNSKMWVYFNVPEAQYLNIMQKNGNDYHQVVKLRMPNNEIFDQPGKIETIEADFNNETGNIAFRAAFQNPKRLLRHGETGSIIIDIPVKNAMLIPQKATYEVMDKRYVYVIDSKNIVRGRMIEIADELPHLYIVSGGLKPNDRILLEGLRKVHEGQKIESTFVKPEDMMNDLDLYSE